MPQDKKRLHGVRVRFLPCYTDSYRQGERERMLRAIGFYAAARRDVVLQTWFGKETDMRRDVELQAKACAN